MIPVDLDKVRPLVEKQRIRNFQNTVPSLSTKRTEGNYETRVFGGIDVQLDFNEMIKNCKIEGINVSKAPQKEEVKGAPPPKVNISVLPDVP